MIYVFVLLALAVVVTLAAPVLRAPERWSVRHPAAALSLWVAAFTIGCTAFVAAAVAVVVVAVSQRQSGAPWLTATAIVVAAWTALGTLGAVFALLGTRVERSREVAHATRTEVLLLTACSTYRTQVIGGVEVFFVRSDEPFALSLRDDGPRIVVSQALEDALEADQLRAVIEHERAHMRWRHDSIVSIAGLAEASIPWLPAGCAFRRSAWLLIELAADDRARRRCGTEASAGALERLHLIGAAPGADLRAKRVRTLATRTRRFSSAGRRSATAPTSR